MSNPPCVILSEVRSSNTPLCHPERSAKHVVEGSEKA